MRNAIIAVIVVTTVFTLTACSALNHRELQLDSKMSETVFLNPDTLSQGAPIYIRFGNTSTYQDADLAKLLADKLIARGYKVTTNAKKALFTIQASLLYIGEETERYTMEGAILGGVGGALGGASATNNKLAGGTAGGTAGAGLGALIGSMIPVDSIIGIIDIKIDERRGGSLAEVAKTRIVVEAKETMMDKAKVKALVADKIAAQVAGIF